MKRLGYWPVPRLRAMVGLSQKPINMHWEISYKYSSKIHPIHSFLLIVSHHLWEIAQVQQLMGLVTVLIMAVPIWIIMDIPITQTTWTQILAIIRHSTKTVNHQSQPTLTQGTPHSPNSQPNPKQNTKSSLTSHPCTRTYQLVSRVLVRMLPWWEGKVKLLAIVLMAVRIKNSSRLKVYNPTSNTARILWTTSL